jgi:hypothetical protein
MRRPNQIVEAGLLEVVDRAERYVPGVLAAALKQTMRISSRMKLRERRASVRTSGEYEDTS